MAEQLHIQNVTNSKWRKTKWPNWNKDTGNTLYKKGRARLQIDSNRFFLLPLPLPLLFLFLFVGVFCFFFLFGLRFMCFSYWLLCLDKGWEHVCQWPNKMAERWKKNSGKHRIRGEHDCQGCGKGLCMQQCRSSADGICYGGACKFISLSHEYGWKVWVKVYVRVSLELLLLLQTTTTANSS